MSVSVEAAKSRLDGLRAIRDRLADAMDEADSGVLAQLSAQLAKVMEQIEAIESATPEVSASDDIKHALAVGLADASVVQLAGRRRQPRTG